MKIAVIDFETANTSRASACALGVAVIEDGTVTVRAETLIKPPEACGWFRDDFIRIHGITPDAVRDAPTFDAVFDAFRPHLAGAVLAAHNAPFDMGVLGALLGTYGISFACESLCTLRLARAAWPRLRSHSLAAVAAHLGVALDHHRAGSDAYAAARILLALRDCGRPALAPYLRRYDWTGVGGCSLEGTGVRYVH